MSSPNVVERRDAGADPRHRLAALEKASRFSESTRVFRIRPAAARARASADAVFQTTLPLAGGRRGARSALSSLLRVRGSSLNPARASRAPLRLVLGRCGQRSCADRSPVCLLDDGLSGTSRHRRLFPWGLSSISALPALMAGVPNAWASRFHAPEAIHPNRSRTSRRFGRPRNLPCADICIITPARTPVDRFL